MLPSLELVVIRLLEASSSAKIIAIQLGEVTVFNLTGVVLGLLGLIGIPLSIRLAKRGRQRPDLRYVVDHDIVISPENGLLSRGLQITFDEQIIEQVSRTTVAIWNNEGDTVHGADIVPDDPLRIVVDADSNDAILQARVVAVSRRQIKAAVKLDREESRSAAVSFDFLDPGDGLVIEVIHQSDEYVPDLAGTIRGAQAREVGGISLAPDRLDEMAQSRWYRRASLITWTEILFVPLIMVIMTAFIFWFAWPNFGASSLVPVDKYDLGTVEGQGEFARQVRNIGSPDPVLRVLPFLLIPIVFAVLLAMVRRLYRQVVRPILPRSILEVRPRDVEQDDEE